MIGATPIHSAAILMSAMAGQQAFTTNNYPYDGPMNRPSGSMLVWVDEFDGSKLDTRKWAYDTAFNKKGWFNKERQYYSANRSKNLRVENGRLIIEARYEPLRLRKYPDWGGQQYSSARIYSKGAGWTYGFYEIRAKLPCARGTWPAIWMLPLAMEKWPDDGEIDIMEHVGSKPHEIVASLHTGFFNHAIGTQRSAQAMLPTSCSEFHRYQLDWRPDAITIGADDWAIMRVKNDQPGGKGAWPFDAPFRLILNLAIGGDWAGAKGIDDAAMPQRMEIDYVKIWQSN